MGVSNFETDESEPKGVGMMLTHALAKLLGSSTSMGLQLFSDSKKGSRMSFEIENKPPQKQSSQVAVTDSYIQDDSAVDLLSLDARDSVSEIPDELSNATPAIDMKVFNLTT